MIKSYSEFKVVDKVWGEEHWIINEEDSNYCFKKLILDKHYKCSYHMHKIKSEHFYIQKGKVFMMIGSDKNYNTYILNIGDLIRIVPGVYHSFIGFTDSIILEVSTYHRESDSYRLDESSRVSNAEISAYNDLYKTGKSNPV